MGEKKTVEALARQFQDQIERILTEKVGGKEKRRTNNGNNIATFTIDFILLLPPPLTP